MALHSSTLAWKISWTEEPGRLQSMGSLRVAHDWATSLSLFTFMHWRRKWQPTPVFLPGESQGWGAWWSSVYGVAQSQTWLKRLSSSSSSRYMWNQKVNFYDNSSSLQKLQLQEGHEGWMDLIRQIGWRQSSTMVKHWQYDVMVRILALSLMSSMTWSSFSLLNWDNMIRWFM